MLEKEKLQLEMKNAIKWIQDYVKNSGAKGVVIGNSGGKDSANFGNPSTREKNHRIRWKRFKV